MGIPTASEQLFQDLRFGLRSMRKSPGFLATAVLSLALGIGANTAIFTVVNAVLLKPLPFPEPDRLVQLWETKPSKSYFRNVVNPINFLDWRERSHSFEDMAAVAGATTNLTGIGDPLALAGAMVSPQYFSVLGVGPFLGRAFTPEEGREDRANVAVLSYGLWQSRFGADSKIVGQKIMINGVPTVVIGVMPRGFALPNSAFEIWTPLPITRAPQWGRGRFMTAIGRLKRGVSLEQAQQDLQAVARQSAIERPAFNTGWSAEAVPMLQDNTQKVRLPLLVLLASVGLVLLIACANVANLLLMRASGRLREIAVRVALGAGRRRLLQQLLAESLALASVACAVGLAAGYWGVKALLALVPPQNELPRMETIHMDGAVLLFALAISILTAAIFGLVPAIQLSQVAPQGMLQQGAVRTGGTGRSLLRQTLVVSEIALALVLLAGAGLMLRSFHNLITTNPGFETQRILTLELFTAPSKYSDDRKRAGYFARMLDDIRSVPGVRAAGSTHFLPLQSRTSGSCFAGINEPPPDTNSPGAEFLVVSPGYLQTMGTPLIEGRQFDARDGFDSPHVILVNQAFAKKFFAGRDPIGQKLNVCWTVHNPVEIVGVVADARQGELQTAPTATIFIDNLQAPMYFAQLAVRVAGDPLQMARSVERAIHRVDPDQPLRHVETMDQVLSESVAQPRLQLVLLAVFGGIAALLAMIGIYGVVAYSVAQRTREIGIRVALGAKPADVRGLVLRESSVLAAAGIGIGLAGALALTRLMRALLYEITPTDPVTLASVAAAVLGIVALATILPARRAARVDPTVALRYE